MTGEGRDYRSEETGRELVPMWDAARQAPEQARAGERVTTSAAPLAVRVWIDAGRSGYSQCDGHAIAWTRTQVQVSYVDRHAREGTAWVWANAVTRRERAPEH